MNTFTISVNAGIEGYNRAIQEFREHYQDFVRETIINNDIPMIIELIEEIIWRLCDLTPHRVDLHDSLKRTVDIELIKQMLEHNAFGSQDFYNMITGILDRIELLQAPADNYKIAELKNRLSGNWEDVVALVFVEIHKLIDEIIDKAKKALADPTIRQYLEVLKNNQDV